MNRVGVLRVEEEAARQHRWSRGSAARSRMLLALVVVALSLAPFSIGKTRHREWQAASVTPVPMATLPRCSVADLHETSDIASTEMSAPASESMSDACLDLEVRVDSWERSGIQFEGDWQADELAPILDGLDAFETTFGRERFLKLIRRAPDVVPRRGAQRLVIARTTNPDLPPGAWAPRSGRIYINDTFYDPQHLRRYYAWTHLWRVADSSQALSPQVVIVAHELGHVLADGVYAGHEAPGNVSAQLAAAYVEGLTPGLQPHMGAPIGESVATELGLWALGAYRPAPVVAFRQGHLAPLIFAESWFAR